MQNLLKVFGVISKFTRTTLSDIVLVSLVLTLNRFRTTRYSSIIFICFS